MQAAIDSTHRQLGELAAMSRQTQDAEQRILTRAQVRLAEVERELPKAASGALTGGEDAYMDLIKERGQLLQVIAQARRNLA